MLTQENKLDKPIEIYKNNKSYQEIVRRKYNINDLGILYDDKILLLIYVCEWFKIPFTNSYDKVCYHPYLTKKDHKKLESIYENQKNNLFLSTLPFYFLLILMKRKYVKGNNLRKNFKPIGLLTASVFIYPYVLWNFILYPKMNKDIQEDSQLQKYFSLDVDQDKIKRDLLNYNIVL